MILSFTSNFSSSKGNINSRSWHYQQNELDSCAAARLIWQMRSPPCCLLLVSTTYVNQFTGVLYPFERNGWISSSYNWQGGHFKNALLLGNQYTSLKAVHDQVQYFRNTTPFKEKKNTSLTKKSKRIIIVLRGNYGIFIALQWSCNATRFRVSFVIVIIYEYFIRRANSPFEHVKVTR